MMIGFCENGMDIISGLLMRVACSPFCRLLIQPACPLRLMPSFQGARPWFNSWSTAGLTWRFVVSWCLMPSAAASLRVPSWSSPHSSWFLRTVPRPLRPAQAVDADGNSLVSLAAAGGCYGTLRLILHLQGLQPETAVCHVVYSFSAPALPLSVPSPLIRVLCSAKYI